MSESCRIGAVSEECFSVAPMALCGTSGKPFSKVVLNKKKIFRIGLGLDFLSN